MTTLKISGKGITEEKFNIPEFLFRANQGLAGDDAADPALKDIFPHPERSHGVSLPRRERERIEFPNKKWINSRRNKPQEKKSGHHYS